MPSLPLDGWAIVLGASSGFGAAACLQFARAGCSIVGVHLDRRSSQPLVDHLATEVEAAGRHAWFYNQNAADPSKCRQILDDVQSRWANLSGEQSVKILLHSLAFGSLTSLVECDQRRHVDLKQLEMTTDVMAHSLVTWVQELVCRGMLKDGGRVLAMTSTGSWTAWPQYGPVSAAKAALEAHVRQLAFELAPRGITVNAVCAGVTDTPALRRIPTADEMIQVALRKNPHHRLTKPEDVAASLVALAQPCTYWMTGNVIQVDGGEAIAG